MPKVSKAGKFRKAAAAPKKDEAPTALSRGQRKRQAKREQYLKREKMILSSLQLKKQEEQKHRLDGLDALKEALATVDTSTSQALNANKPVASYTLKGRKKLAAREMQHMNLVLDHPAFQSNPFETIQQHLRNTLAGSAKEQEQKSKERTKTDRQGKEAKKQQKRERIQAAGGKHRKKFHAARKSK